MNLSWPAVSQICSLHFTPSTTNFLTRKLAPIVDGTEEGLNWPAVYLWTMLVFPTPVGIEQRMKSVIFGNRCTEQRYARLTLCSQDDDFCFHEIHCEWVRSVEMDPSWMCALKKSLGVELFNDDDESVAKLKLCSNWYWRWPEPLFYWISRLVAVRNSWLLKGLMDVLFCSDFDQGEFFAWTFVISSSETENNHNQVLYT